MLQTIAKFNKMLEIRQDRKVYRKGLADIYRKPDLRYNDIRIERKMNTIQDKKDIQRPPKAIEREKGVDVTPRMAGKLMLSYLRSKPHKPHLIEELRIRGVVDGISEGTRWNTLVKKMKAATENERGWFTPLSFFLREIIDNILKTRAS